MIEQAKAAIEAKKNAAMAGVGTSSFYFVIEYEKLLKDRLSNKKLKLVENVR
jgi:F0F1-type ATP synthase membrane subunit b/b'